MRRFVGCLAIVSLMACLWTMTKARVFAQDAQAAVNPLTNAFSAGWMAKDSNGDGLIDAIEGKIVVPSNPTAAENAAAANLAARLGFISTGLTLPIVVTAADPADRAPKIWIGQSALPPESLRELEPLTSDFEKGEGGVFVIGNNLAVLAKDEAGLLEAANSFSARAPYVWKVSGEKLSDIAQTVTSSANGSPVALIGVTYEHGKLGIRRAFLRSVSEISVAALTQALSSPHLTDVHELIVLGGKQPVSAISSKPMAEAPAAHAASASASTAESGQPPENASAEEGSLRLDLATIYTSKGLFKGTPKMPIPSSLNGHLYIPAGPAGTAMANLAARMGLETIGIKLPLAFPDASVNSKEIKSPVVIDGNSPIGVDAEKVAHAEDLADGGAPLSLSAGEGELRVVDNAFAKNPAVLVLGDESGSSAALNLLSGRFPNLWAPAKQYLSLEEIRYDLHRLFSLHSGVGQAAVALYHLDQWAKEIPRNSTANSGVHDVKAEVYVDLADPNLAGFVRRMLEQELNVSNVEVKTGSLHAGTQCCDKDPDLHYQSPEYAFHQGVPTFSEDLVIPWEGERLLDAVRSAIPKIKPGRPISLVARVSEGPQERAKLTSTLEQILTKAGVPRAKMHVEVLCAYKQGYSWLMDEIAPALEGKQVASLKISFAKDVDPTGVRSMYTSARWVQELYPVDEMLSRKLKISLENITFNEFSPQPSDPTYRVQAYDGEGHEILNRSFRVTTVMQPYNGVMPRYEQVQVETGWVRLENGSTVLLDRRIKTDIEEFWDHYQNVTLPKIYHFIMAQAQGDIRTEYQPLFDTLRMDIRMSEPDYDIGLDKERISSLEALQEDTLYSTANFFEMMGDLEAGRGVDYPGRIIPIVHPSQDGQDGRVHIEFYGKPAANPLVRLSWKDADGLRHSRERNLPALAGAFQPRLVEARIKNGLTSVENLTWELPADYLKDDYDNWINVELRDRVEHTVFSVEQAEGQLHWLELMHEAGLYRDEIAYPHLKHMTMLFKLPRALDAKVDSPAPGAIMSWNIPMPGTPRPMISDYAEKITRTPIVQWDEPISPDENAGILARLAAYPGVNVYWMGRSYLGQNLWAADMMLPSPSTLHSWAKETTLKASIIYSGRQHANEVSSTSHIDKLGELLVTDPATRSYLKQVNVVLHPIDNTDGAQLSVELAKITPENLLHPGYHGSLIADVVEGERETDPIYPESRTRPQLIHAWLPDAFLNPHGYPSHEWVQPFSEYTAWVMSREGEAGREWWLPRGWFTSMGYTDDPQHPYSKQIAYALRDRIVEAERNVPGLLPLEERMNARYERFGQRWNPRYMAQPIVDGIRVYMALKGSPATPGTGISGGISPDITWDSGYTEAPDETAHGDYMKLVASAGLAWDLVHLKYLAQGKLRISRTEKDASDGVEWRVERARPILPSSEPPIPPLPKD